MRSNWGRWQNSPHHWGQKILAKYCPLPSTTGWRRDDRGTTKSGGHQALVPVLVCAAGPGRYQYHKDEQDGRKNVSPRFLSIHKAADALIPLLHSPSHPPGVEGNHNGARRTEELWLLLPLLKAKQWVEQWEEKCKGLKVELFTSCILSLAKQDEKMCRAYNPREPYQDYWTSFSKPWQRCASQQPLASMVAGRTLHVSPLQGSQPHL